MSQTLQAVRYPHLVLDEMLRVGRSALCRFPILVGGVRGLFGFARSRTGVGIHALHLVRYAQHPFCTVDDFEGFLS